MRPSVIFESDAVSIRRLELGAWSTNCYIAVCRTTLQSVLIDVPPGARTLVKEVRGTELKRVLLTHNHIDHYAGLKALRDRLPASVSIHPDDIKEWLPFPPEIALKDGDVIRVGKLEIAVIYTPGHTPGSVCYRMGDILIGGDTLFPGGPGRTISPQAFTSILNSVKGIMALPDQTKIFPGHGESTSVGRERPLVEAFLSRGHQPNLHGDVVWLTS